MTADVRIRAFRPADLPRLQKIRDAAFKPVFRSFRRIVGDSIAPVAFAGLEKEQAALLDRICASDSTRAVLVVEHEAEIIAFCAVSTDPETQVGEIDLNAVHPNHQGRGVGTLMFEAAMEKMREAGMKVATVGTGGDPSHAPARRAYEKAGFGPAIPSVYLYRSL